MIKILDNIMLIIDILLIIYFYNYAVDTTDIVQRLISCAAITMEISFIIRHIKLMKSKKVN